MRGAARRSPARLSAHSSVGEPRPAVAAGSQAEGQAAAPAAVDITGSDRTKRRLERADERVDLALQRGTMALMECVCAKHARLRTVRVASAIHAQPSISACFGSVHVRMRTRLRRCACACAATQARAVRCVARTLRCSRMATRCCTVATSARTAGACAPSTALACNARHSAVACIAPDGSDASRGRARPVDRNTQRLRARQGLQRLRCAVQCSAAQQRPFGFGFGFAL